MIRKDIDIDNSVVWLLEVAAHLHSRTEFGMDNFLEECRWIYEKEVKKMEIIDEDN